MAMEGTHVRFAKDLAGRLGVLDFIAYYSGAAYPDSRYTTGIPREATHHDPGCPQDPFAAGLTDFEKGWATHLLYDHEAALIKKDVLSGIPDDLRGDDGWAFATAVKLVEDMESVRLLGGDVNLLRSLQCVLCPLGEQIDLMERYYADLREAYDIQRAIASDYLAFSLKAGMPLSRANRMIAIAERLAADPTIKDSILAIYPRVLSLLP